MKIFKSLVTAFLCVFYWIPSSWAETQSLSVPIDFQFLNRGNSPIDGQFFIRGGQVFVTGADGTETSSSLGSLSGSKGAAFSGAAETILGAPVVVFARQEVAVPASLNNTKATLRAVVQPNSILFVQETRKLAPVSPKQVVTEFAVSQLANDKLTQLGRFSFQENTFNQYLSEVWPISDAQLAIVTRSSRHSRLNTLFMFDVKKRQLVGMSEFSLLQYLPATSSVWIAQSVANCDNIEDVFAEAKRKAQVLRLFDGNEPSRDFQSLEGIDGDVLRKAETASPVKSSSASLPMVNPHSSQESLETKPTSAPSEERPSSTPWSVIVVLIVAAIGLLWLLVKKRK
jgi:hypothetical protein